MPQEPFEKFIKHLLDQAAESDALREIANQNSNSSLLSTVNSYLLEESIAAQFDHNGYESEAQKQKVLSKLHLVKNKLDSNLIDHHDSRYITLKICINHVEQGYALTKEIADYLNKIYNEL